MKKDNEKKLVNVFYKKEDLDKSALKNIMVSKKGLVEIRNLGPITFNIPAKSVPGYEDINLGIEAKQKIPIEMLMQIMAFFSYVYNENKSEAGALIIYDVNDKCYKVNIPEQTVSGASAKWDRNKCFDPKKEIPIMELHSHPWGDSASPSSIDNKDELENFGLFAVTGNFEKLMPIRATNSGESLSVDISDIFEFEFPSEWLKKVTVAKTETKDLTNLRGAFARGITLDPLDTCNKYSEVIEGINHPMELEGFSQDMENQIDMLTDRIFTIAENDDKILVAIAKLLEAYDTNDELYANKSHWDWR